MNITDVKDCYYQPGTLTIIDTIHPTTGLGLYGKKTLADVKEEYEGAEIWDFDKAIAHKEESDKTTPQEISAERFDEMLCVLPPSGWVRRDGAESFKMSERWSGSITSIFCRIGEKFFEFRDTIATSHDEICKKCLAI